MSFDFSNIDWNAFKNPPKSARPMVRWWWTGLDVDKNELIKEVQELDEAGFLGAEIQAFMIGSPMKLEKKDKERAARSHRFMQPYYYEMVKAVLGEAAKRDMLIDLTIGSAWPTGGVHISKEDSMKVLLLGQKIIRGPKKIIQKVPAFKKPFFYKLTRLAKIIIGYNIMELFKEDMKLEAVIAAKPIKKPGKIKFLRVKTSYYDANSIIDITDKVNDQGEINWNSPEGKWQIFSFYKGPSGSRPLQDCRATPDRYSLVLDHLSSKTIKNHLDKHLGEGKKYFGEHYGKTLRAFFTDSLELSSDWLYTDDFLEQFKNRRGYDLKPYLPVCFVPNRDNKYLQALLGGDVPCFDFKDGIGERIRYDFELTISDLFSEEFVRTMYNWANANDLKSRIQAYGIRTDTLKAYGFSHIPETEQLYAGGIIDFLKFAGSAGSIYEKPIVTAESIVWNQRDYMTTPLKWKVAADRLFVSGINQMIYHGFPYQNPLFPYPGFCGFSTPYLPRQTNYSSNFSRANPFWEFFPIMNDCITRCQYILQRGKTISNIAIFYPVFNYCDSVLKKEELVGGYLDENDAPCAKRQINAHIKKAKKLDANDKWTLNLLKISDDLTSNGFFYTHVNEDAILNSKIENKRVLIGAAEFQALIFTNISDISLKLAEKLKKIAESGVFVVFIDKIPQKQPGFINYLENDEKIKQMVKTLIELKKAHFIEDNLSLSKFLMEDLNIKPGIIFEMAQTAIQYIHKKTECSDYYFLRNSKNQSIEIGIKFLYPDKIPFILDPWTGNAYQAIQYNREKDYILMKLYFAPYDSYFIEFKDAPEELHIVEGTLKAKKMDGKVIGFVDKPGKYYIKLSDGAINNYDIESEALPSMILAKWHLKTNLRDYLGNITPFETDLERLKDWREIPALKYCSSRGLYSTRIVLEDKFFQDNSNIILSLGRVHDAAIVSINKNVLPPLLVYPFVIDITPYVIKGENFIEIEVIPTLRNQLIGYGKKGGKNWKNHKHKKEFMPSGLIEPVSVKLIKIVSINT